ncbi:MAG: DNA translocase FtsK 4TM domain-containing protein [Patescibacteria group bacterium]
MAKKATRKKERRNPWDTETNDEPNKQLSDETKRGIIVVVLFVVAFLILLSFFEIAGVVGEYIDLALGMAIGWSRYFLPFILAGVGLALLKPDYVPIRIMSYVGLVLFFISTAGLFHLTLSQDSTRSAIDDGFGGGGLGYGVREPLENFMGGWATLIVLLALFVIALLVMFNMTLHQLIQKRTFLDRLANRIKYWFYRVKMSRGFKEDAEHTDQPASFQKRELSEGEELEEIEDESGEPREKTQTEMFPKLKRKRKKIDVPLDLLENIHQKPMSGNIEENKLKIKKTLETFGISVEMGEVHVGPTVTQYTLKPAEGVKLAQITTLLNDLALSLAAHPLRIEAPIPGQSLVGIEVPNKASALVTIKEILGSSTFKERRSNLSMAIGKDVAGNPWVSDLGPMPHLLIAGSTGSGKSVCINSIIISLLYSNSPNDLKLILVDPKRVELTIYNDIPHLLTPVITDVTKTINALKWVVGEMDRRFEILSKTGKRNIQVYHREIDDSMPYIVVIIDELADLMAVSANDVEGAIIRLAQMARAVGIHLIVATQRPSVDVITGLIKANITSRIAFNVASLVDSRTILDHSGAEKLLGKGDMLYLSSDLSKPKRLQGAYVSDKEIEKVVEFLQEQEHPEYNSEIVEKPASKTFDDLETEGDDELLIEAKETILRAGKASASLLQRRLRIGYARAARILDLLEEQSFIGPGEGAKPREVLVSQKAYFTGQSDDAEENPEEEAKEEEEEEPDNGDYYDTDEKDD